MKFYSRPSRFIVIFVFLVTASFSVSIQISQAQSNPLTLAQVLVGLQSQSGNLTLAEKNEFITKRVEQLGVTFRLTPEIEKEVRQAGASAELINAIRLKTPKPTPTPSTSTTPDDEKPDADFEKIWVEQNIVDDGKRGIRIFATFNVYNLKDVKSDLVFRFQKDGKLLEGKTTGFQTSTGDLSARRYLTPAYTAAVYDSLSVFLPYAEIDLPPGSYDLKLDADVVLRDGTMVKHLTLQDLTLVVPGEKPRTGSATMEKIWVDYGVTQDGKLGMVIHVKIVVRNMKDEDAYLQVLFEKSDGTKLYSNNKTYQNKDGQTAVFRGIRPVSEVTNFADLSAFFPYDEFNLGVGKYKLKMDVDLIYGDYTLVNHLTFHPFTYTRRR